MLVQTDYMNETANCLYLGCKCASFSFHNLKRKENMWLWNRWLWEYRCHTTGQMTKLEPDWCQILLNVKHGKNSIFEPLLNWCLYCTCLRQCVCDMRIECGRDNLWHHLYIPCSQFFLTGYHILGQPCPDEPISGWERWHWEQATLVTGHYDKLWSQNGHFQFHCNLDWHPQG